MSKYDKETKFYWLQLKEDFFENDAIEWLEEQKPNGRDYAYFYLKLCLKSLKSNGILIRKVGNVLIPYDNRKLAELTKIDFDTVTVAMELLKKIGLVTIFESGEIYINQLDNLIGSQSKGAFKKQQQRLLGRQLADKCLPKIEIDIEIDKKKESIKKEKNNKKSADALTPLILNNNFYKENEDLKQKVIEWLQYKKEKKEYYKETGFKSLLKQIENKVKDYDKDSVINLIDECMANNWKGIIFDKLKTKPKKERDPYEGVQRM